MVPVTDIPLEARVYLNALYRYVVFSENGKVFFGLSEEVVRGVLESRFLAGRLISHRGEDGEIDGVMMWYRCHRGWTWEKIRNWEGDDEDGGEIFIAAAIADNPKARRVGILRFLAKEPDALHLPLSTMRHKAGKEYPERVEYSQKLLARLLK